MEEVLVGSEAVVRSEVVVRMILLGWMSTQVIYHLDTAVPMADSQLSASQKTANSQRVRQYDARGDCAPDQAPARFPTSDSTAASERAFFSCSAAHGNGLWSMLTQFTRTKSEPWTKVQHVSKTLRLRDQLPPWPMPTCSRLPCLGRPVGYVPAHQPCEPCQDRRAGPQA